MAATTSVPSLFGTTGSPARGRSTSIVASTIPSSVVQSLASLGASAAPGQAAGAANSSTPATSDGVAQPIVRSQVPIFSCTPASYNITGGLPPYTAFIIRSGDVNASAIHTLPSQFAPGTGSWGVDLAPGTSITFVAKDARNATGYSVPVVIQTGPTSCIEGFASASGSSTTSPSHIGAIVGGVVGGLGGLALISVLVWALIIRPARKAKLREPGFYEDEDHMSASTEPKSYSSDRPIAPIGSYNLGAIDYRAPTLPPEVQERTPLPRYHDDRR